MTTRLLSGLTLLNTRPQGQGDDLNQRILALGGAVIDLPALVIKPLDTKWIKALPDPSHCEKAIFISANAVRFFFKALQQQQIPWPADIPLLAIGQATAEALSAYCNNPVTIPSQADSEHLLALPCLQAVVGCHIWLIKGQGGRKTIEDTLTSRGAQLQIIAVYQRLIPQINQEKLQSIWHNDAVDIILCTSSQAIDNLLALFGQAAATWLKHKPVLLFGERLANHARALGFTQLMMTRPEQIIHALSQFKQGHTHGNEQ